MFKKMHALRDKKLKSTYLFKKGSFVLKNLELRREVFLMNNLNLEVVDSLVSQLKISIPWKAIKTEVKRKKMALK